jgi:hypothetical protein
MLIHSSTILISVGIAHRNMEDVVQRKQSFVTKSIFLFKFICYTEIHRIEAEVRRDFHFPCSLAKEKTRMVSPGLFVTLSILLIQTCPPV